MPIIRQDKAAISKASFSVGVNVILTGSKKLSQEQQEELMAVEKVRILICDANDPENVLVDEIAPAHEFNTGSVGYGLHIRDIQFKK